MNQDIKKEKIGILGGSFNPIHNGHLGIARAAYEQLELDKILFLPNGNPPHKQDQILLDASDRMRMVELAIQGKSHYAVSSYEIDKNKPCYSADTLTAFADIYPKQELYFLMGADSLNDFSTWYRPDIISQKASLAVVQREDMNDEMLLEKAAEIKQKYHADIRIVHMPKIEISSSRIRSMIAGGKDVSMYLPASVLAYINERHLYEI